MWNNTPIHDLYIPNLHAGAVWCYNGEQNLETHIIRMVKIHIVIYEYNITTIQG